MKGNSLISARWEVVLLKEPISKHKQIVDYFFDINFPGRFPKQRASNLINSLVHNQSAQAKPGFIALAVTELGELAGIMTARPRTLLMETAEFCAYEMGNTFTNPKFRNQGSALISTGIPYLDRSVFGRLFFTLEQELRDQTDLIYGIPNEEAKRAWVNSAGFQELSPSPFGVVTIYCSFGMKRKITNLFKKAKRNRLETYDKASNQIYSEIYQLIEPGESAQTIANINDTVLYYRKSSVDFKILVDETKSKDLFALVRERQINNRSIAQVILLLSREKSIPKRAMLIKELHCSLENYDRVILLANSKVRKELVKARLLFRFTEMNVVYKSFSGNKDKSYASGLTKVFSKFQYLETDLI